MAARNQYKVLYFIQSAAPTEEQREDILQYGPHAVFRNALHVTPTEHPEPCTAVAGDVPEAYAKRLPIAVSYDDWRHGLLPEPPAFTEPASEATDGEVDGVDILPPPGDPFEPQGRPVRSRRQQEAWGKNA